MAFRAIGKSGSAAPPGAGSGSPLGQIGTGFDTPSQPIWSMP